jgi:hypothetical protein
MPLKSPKNKIPVSHTNLKTYTLCELQSYTVPELYEGNALTEKPEGTQQFQVRLQITQTLGTTFLR